MTGVLIIRREKTQIHKEKPCEDRGRDWNDTSASQEMPKIAHHHQKLRERHGKDFPSEPSKETIPADTLILDF